MLNLNSCNCNDANANKRNHHGVVCTRCNPSNIETLLIPNEINAIELGVLILKLV